MVCLETDFLVDFLRGNENAVKKMVSLKSSKEKLCITPITATEIFFGAIKTHKTSEVNKTKSFLSFFGLMEYDLVASLLSAEVLNFLETKGEKIGEKDSITAGITIRHGERLLTRNKKHFSKVPHLEIEIY